MTGPTTAKSFWKEVSEEPQIIAETPAYLVVYKPPRMHTAPLPKKEGAEKNLLDWVFPLFPGLSAVRGRRENEGGLLHRLDYETCGLVLIARTGEAWNCLADQQKNGGFVKEYEAFSLGAEKKLPGFPRKTAWSGPETGNVPGSWQIESAFRSYGPGAKEVRPIPPEKAGTDRNIYRTEGKAEPCRDGFFRLRLSKGFRHQIRCHLAWAGQPLVNDSLYGGIMVPQGDHGDPLPGFLALRASALLFTDPLSGKKQRISQT